MQEISLEKYGFSRQAMKAVQPIIKTIDERHIFQAEQLLSELTLEVCDRVEEGTLTPQEGDDYFTLIDLYIGSHFSHLKFKRETHSILFEGMILHDYGKDFGADLDTMRRLAESILGVQRQ